MNSGIRWIIRAKRLLAVNFKTPTLGVAFVVRSLQPAPRLPLARSISLFAGHAGAMGGKDVHVASIPVCPVLVEFRSATSLLGQQDAIRRLASGWRIFTCRTYFKTPV